MSDVPFPASELLDRWSTGWTSGNVDALTNLWHDRYPNLTFLATERNQPITTIGGVREYYEQLLGLFQPDTWVPLDVIVDRLTPDLVLLRCKMRMDYRLPDFEGEDSSSWRGRCCQVWRLQEDRTWRLIHKEDSTNEFDRAVNLVRRLEHVRPVEEVLVTGRVWMPFVDGP